MEKGEQSAQTEAAKTFNSIPDSVQDVSTPSSIPGAPASIFRAPAYKLIRFRLNGKPVEKMTDVRSSLTDLLRLSCHCTSVKKGCEVGECGACTVLIDGEAFNSCIYLAVWAEGKDVRTLEGLLGTDGELSDLQKAFVEEAAIQCGFCTPGFLMTASEILDAKTLYTDDQLRRLLSGHLCRCTGYENILRAVRKAMYRNLGQEPPGSGEENGKE
ncbi:MAG: (2Fe-2S)-binding protein [Oscillibacter sp.]|nr:(2Fe-2S)-binding protein [Oscillibacter sp.]